MKKNGLENLTSRREFFKYVGSFFATGLILSTTYPILTSCEKDESLPIPPSGTNLTVNLKDHPELTTVPSIKKIAFKTPSNLTLIVKRVSQATFIVFQAYCPHQGVELELPQNPNGNIVCLRHSVEFSSGDTNKGDVVSNPQGVRVGNLPTYQSEFDQAKNILTIKLS